MQWRFLEPNVIRLRKIVKHGVPALLARVMANRGMDGDTADKLINNPAALIEDPAQIINCEAAAIKILEYADKDNTEIWIYADYDADGITSGYIITDYLRKISSNPIYVYYPDREEEYGLDMNFCQAMREKKERDNIDILVVTVDNGVSCITEAQFLKDSGIETVVIDHHLPQAQLPRCIICNPHIAPESPGQHLAGCGVTLKVVTMMDRILSANGYEQIRHLKYYPAVAIGTVADMMPMTPENQALIRVGLKQLNSESCPINFELWKEFLGKDELTADDISWEIAPRLNACGRMGKIQKAAAFFFCDEDKEKHDSRDIVITIEEINAERKRQTSAAEKEIAKLNFDNDLICIFDGSKYAPGIAGVIANKLLERFGKPSFVFTGSEDMLAGSARSPQGLSLPALMSKEVAKKNLVGYGGHEAACGFSIKREKLQDFRQGMNETLAALATQETGIQAELTLNVDAIISLDMVNKTNHEALSSIAYDKEYFRAPVLALQGLEIKSSKTSKNNPENICFTFNYGKYGFNIWAWGMGSYYKTLGSPKKIDIAGMIDRDFTNKKRFTMRIIDIRASQ